MVNVFPSASELYDLRSSKGTKNEFHKNETIAYSMPYY
jgi:hypothetical protein